ncbi:MAG: hypothetical protein B6I29_04080 [Marinitoga sp. 4572_148]|nr:MAG: hypothetical protein B6I29_04080 [Marinitoga sp. 4572_148]
MKNKIWMNSKKKNSWIWLATLGHDNNILKKMSFYIRADDLIDENIVLYDDVLEYRKKLMSQYTYELLKKATKPIKSTLSKYLKIDEKLWVVFSLDISKDSEKNFSKDSQETLKLFGNLAKIYLKNRIEKEKMIELIKNLKYKNYEYQKLNEELHNKYRTFIDSIYKLSKLLISSSDENYLIKESLKICAESIPFFDKAIFAKKIDNKIIIKDSMGYENLMVKELKIQSEVKKNNMDIISFSEIEGEFYQIKVFSQYYILIKLNEKNREYIIDEYNLSFKYENIVHLLIKLKNRLNKEKFFSKNLIKALIDLFDKNNIYKLKPSEKTAYYATLIGKRMGFDEERLEKLYWAAIFHDIGKVVISQNILIKTSNITIEEYDEIKKHTILGYEIILKYFGDEELAEIIKYHHERYDGKGYPEGLKGEEIPIESRIIAVVNAYAEMITKKTYGITLSKEEAKRRIKKKKQREES